MNARLTPYKRAPRLKVKEAGWRVGDTVHVGSTRWIIRTITGQAVELEASSVSPGIWWDTTVDKLPTKVEARS